MRLVQHQPEANTCMLRCPCSSCNNKKLQNKDDRIVALETQNATILTELAGKKDKRGDNGKK
ncbi:hypothetical protein IGI04_003178 [Brassica rapa subsp. trilocularis]|uniref:CRC domain-containing protein n=1 Tax=Brassica rapa subsp. trilocularis TaxID=1813537 RepID=A0ABQ7NZN4_BRACM|nr:hypothetical protein IGI04_003178 [Brassica rapa subsp. trilocularis]